MHGIYRCAVVAAATVGFVFVGGASVMTAPSSGSGDRGVSHATEVVLEETGGGGRAADSGYEIEVTRGGERPTVVHSGHGGR